MQTYLLVTVLNKYFVVVRSLIFLLIIAVQFGVAEALHPAVAVHVVTRARDQDPKAVPDLAPDHNLRHRLAPLVAVILDRDLRQYREGTARPAF